MTFFEAVVGHFPGPVCSVQSFPLGPMLNCNSQRAEGLQEAFFSPADRIQGSFISQLLVPSVVDTLESSNSSQEIQSQDLQKPGPIQLQGFEDHSLFGASTHSNMGSLDMLAGSSGMSMAMDTGDMKFADIDTWNSLGPGPSMSSITYRGLLASSSLMDHSSMDYANHSGSLEKVTCTAMQSPMYERSTRMDSCRDSDSSLSSQSQSFHSSLLPPVSINSNLSRNTAVQGGGPGPGSGGIALPIRKGTSFDAGLGLNIHHPRFDYNLGQQFMNMETPTFMNHSMESQIHLGTPISLDQAVLCGLPINAYNVGGAGMTLPTENQGLTHFAQILPSKVLKSSPVQFTAPQNFLFGSNLTAAPTGLKLPALNFKCNPPKLEQLSPKLFDGYTASQQSSVCDGRPPKKERHSETYISFRGTKNVVDDAESTGPIDLFTKNINVMAGSPGIGSLSSEQSTHTSTSPDSVSKRPRLQDQAPAAANLPFKVRKEKLGEKITALQQLVSPFGKTDTASVLLEAINYIKFLRDQVQLLSTPYMKNVCIPNSTHDMKQQWAADNVKTGGGEGDLSDLRSKGLCLIPISTIRVANDNGADYWTPTIGGSSR